jgi:hypothetical protein
MIVWAVAPLLLLAAGFIYLKTPQRHGLLLALLLALIAAHVLDELVVRGRALLQPT